MNAKHSNYNQSSNVFPPGRRFHLAPVWKDPGGEGRG